MSTAARPELDRNAWREILFNASAALQENPDDAEAEEWVERARTQLQETLPEFAREQTEGKRRDQAMIDEIAPVGPLGKAASAALGAAQGVTMGLSDEAAAAIEAAARAAIPGGKGFKDTYREARDAERATRQAAPGYALAGDIAGSLIGPGAAVGRLARGAVGASKLARAGRTAAVLGATGAAEGAARGEGPEGRIAGAVLGGGGGAALGGLPVALAIGKEYTMLPFSPAGRGLRALRRAHVAEGAAPAGRLLTEAEVAARRAARAMEQPTYLRRGQPTPPNRVVRMPDGAEVIPPPKRPGEILQKVARVRSERTRRKPGELLQRVKQIAEPEVVGEPAAEARRQVLAAAKVQQQLVRGERGPRGGALVGSKARAGANRIDLLAQQLRDLPAEKLEAELANPMVEDWVKDAARQELARRSGGAAGRTPFPG